MTEPIDRPPTTDLLYVRLNVTNVRRGADWYMDVFGMHVTQGHPDTDHVLLREPHSGMEIALMRWPKADAERFDKRRIGLNHIEFGVVSDAELQRWAQYLDEKRIPRLPIDGHSAARWITFRDPDGIILEICLATQ